MVFLFQICFLLYKDVSHSWIPKQGIGIKSPVKNFSDEIKSAYTQTKISENNIWLPSLYEPMNNCEFS